MFDGNLAPDGAAMNIAHYSAKFTNVTFKNNRGSTIRVSFVIYMYHRIKYVLTLSAIFNV